MGEAGAFLRVGREEHAVCDATEAITNFDDFVRPLGLDDQETQASRCMDCGVAFCQSGVCLSGAGKPTGCPLHNAIPEFNDLLFGGLVDQANARLAMTNPFPEFTGRVCPAMCEQACNLGLHDAPVTIRDNERAISDYAWANDCVKPAWAVSAGDDGCAAAGASASSDDGACGSKPLVTVVGSGPAGLAAAWELAAAGIRVRIVEKDDRPGGLLMYGIPNMKLPKGVIERRVDLMRECGIKIDCGIDGAAEADALLGESDAVVLACGFGVPRTLGIEGESLGNVEFAVDYLTAATRAYLGDGESAISAYGKDVVVIGGGDTGVDCVATALRQGAKSVRQVIRASAPDLEAASAHANEVWAKWPNARGIQPAGYGQIEAAQVFGEDPRVWSTDTVALRSGVDAAAVEGGTAPSVASAGEDATASDVASVVLSKRGSDETYEIQAQLVLIAKGFVGCPQDVMDAYGLTVAHEGKPVALTESGTHRALSNSEKPVFIAGDFANGSTLVATAIADGIASAREVISTLAMQ